MINRFYYYPGWIRMWHLINALCCLSLIYTGISMQYADLNFLLVKFKKAVTVHNISGVILLISYLIFVIGNGVTKNGRFYTFSIKKLLHKIKKQIRYYSVGMFKGEKSPYPLSKKRKFNPLQQFTYSMVMYVLLPFSIITGVAMLFPVLIITKICNISGVLIVDLFHVSVGFLISVFLIIHIYFSTIGFKKNFKAIVNGWYEHE